MDTPKIISTNSDSPKSRPRKRLLSGHTGMSAPKAEPGKDYQEWPISDVHYHYMHDMLSHDAMILGIAYRMTGKEIYAQHAAEILKLYADNYKDYPIVDNYGRSSLSGVHASNSASLSDREACLRPKEV
jgi:hypothetical protein